MVIQTDRQFKLIMAQWISSILSMFPNQRPVKFLSPLCTLAPFLSPSVRTPNSRLRRKYEISSSVKISGREPTAPSTWPTIRSARQRVGSIFVPTPVEGNFVSYISAVIFF